MHQAEMTEFARTRDALKGLGMDLGKLARRRPDVCVVMPEGDSENVAFLRLCWQLLGAGVDFDARPATEAGGYRRRLAPGASVPVSLARDAGRPSRGYQVAYLRDAKGGLCVAYLRNVAGGIVNIGDGRSLYVRRPAPAIAALSAPSKEPWRRARAYDLDDGRLVTAAPDGRGGWAVGRASTHDYVLVLSR
jgi:hypothetical protein